MNAIRVLEESGLTIGIAALGMHGDVQGSVRQQVHDGDTVTVRPVGNFGVRMLGIDTPEISFSLPGQSRFVSLSDARWEEFLRDPFDARWPAFPRPVPEGLRRHLAARCGPGTAATHHKHARAAEQTLEAEIMADMEAMGRTAADFQFFLAFAFEVMDGYGRFLCYANRDQPDRNQPGPRPNTYNERLLEAGRAVPYYIWPNVNPWRKADSVLAAVPPPGTARTLADADERLRNAREWVRRCRREHIGVFDAMEPLTLEPFELRLLARRELPGRWVIDLTKNDDVLLRPENYPSITHPEDRLFIPAEYVPLFIERGWRREA